MNKYRVEFRRNSKDYFGKDCNENKLEETKQLIKEIKNEEETGKCFYRKFPLRESQKIYF
ncbi:TPA: hypothetical protein PTV74_002124 [Clostridium botulinum]|nr:hypothetical protein [Clostridium botulinum]HDK7193293.1 hypothetical protein [Clostridium botulinum]HDK7205143.1 hypothetical protein [Clostridium botulinum]HDK7209163.1 hypothetical protein [Clostridium botulinum]HDK7264323.1 hypothetical protein [Clostridium botulinum]